MQVRLQIICCILLGNWQLKNSIDDWLVQQPQKLTVGASGCQPCTNFYSLWGHKWDEQIMCVAVYLKEFLGCVVLHKLCQLNSLRSDTLQMLDYSFGPMSNLMRFHTVTFQNPQTLLPSLQLEVRTSIYATLIDLNHKFGGTIIILEL